jgi:hypothetical protein
MISSWQVAFMESPSVLVSPAQAPRGWRTMMTQLINLKPPRRASRIRRARCVASCRVPTAPPRSPDSLDRAGGSCRWCAPAVCAGPARGALPRKAMGGLRTRLAGHPMGSPICRSMRAVYHASPQTPAFASASSIRDSQKVAQVPYGDLPVDVTEVGWLGVSS